MVPGGGSKYKTFLLTAAATLCWTIWLSRNEVVFDKCKPKTFLQVLFRGTFWLRQWASLHCLEEDQEELREICQLLEGAALQFFASFGWLSSSRLGFH